MATNGAGISGLMSAQYASAVSPSGESGASSSAKSLGGDGFSALLQMMMAVSPVMAQAVGQGVSTDASAGTQTAGTQGTTQSPMDALVAQLQAQGVDVTQMSATQLLSTLQSDPALVQDLLARMQTASVSTQDPMQDALARLAQGMGAATSRSSKQTENTESGATANTTVPVAGESKKTGLDALFSGGDATIDSKDMADILAQAEAALAKVQNKAPASATKVVAEKPATVSGETMSQIPVAPQRAEVLTPVVDANAGAQDQTVFGSKDIASVIGQKTENAQAFTFVPGGELSGARQPVVTVQTPMMQQVRHTEASSVTWHTYSPDDVKTFAAELGARITAGSQQVKITMTPQHLGEMTVSVKMDAAQGMKLDVIVDSVQAKDLVEKNVSALKDAFGESGIKLASLDVNVREQRQGQHDATQQTGEESSRRQNRAQSEESAFAREQREREERQRDLTMRMQLAGASRGVNFWA
jgi:flagellar hook-length control protein FliK